MFATMANNALLIALKQQHRNAVGNDILEPSKAQQKNGNAIAVRFHSGGWSWITADDFTDVGILPR